MSNVPSSTDEIILSYENKLIQSIAFKTLNASKNKIPPILTEEETLYLNKQSEDISDNEINVITPSPQFTLKKGKTEIKVKNIPKVLKKIDELYPSCDTNISQKHLDVAKQNLVQFEEGMKHCESGDSQIFKISNSSTIQTESLDNTKKVIEEAFNIPKPVPINKNAYEIRADVLSMALNWIKFKHDAYGYTQHNSTEDDVLSIALKFYKFVENRR